MTLRRSLSQFICFSGRQYNFPPCCCKTLAEVAMADVKCRVSRNRKKVGKDITKYRSWTCLAMELWKSFKFSEPQFPLLLSACAQSCLTLCDTMDYSMGSSVCGNILARILDWVTISYPRGSSQPKDPTRNSCIGRHILLLLNYLESPFQAAKSLFPLKVLV